jgi:hypothetical protein
LSYLKGRVLSTDGRAVECMIRDFSAAGARIEVSDDTALPSEIELFFPLKQATYRARVRWRGDNEVGLSFDAPDSIVPADPVQAQLHERLLRVEAENAELRLETAQLRMQLEHVAAGGVAYADSETAPLEGARDKR